MIKCAAIGALLGALFAYSIVEALGAEKDYWETIVEARTDAMNAQSQALNPVEEKVVMGDYSIYAMLIGPCSDGTLICTTPDQLQHLFDVLARSANMQGFTEGIGSMADSIIKTCTDFQPRQMIVRHSSGVMYDFYCQQWNPDDETNDNTTK